MSTYCKQLTYVTAGSEIDGIACRLGGRGRQSLPSGRAAHGSLEGIAVEEDIIERHTIEMRTINRLFDEGAA